MKCRNCGTSNPETHRFCNECGSRLELLCPDCGYGNPPASRFCGGCGHDLRTPHAAALPRDLSFDEKLAKIQKYLPGGLTEKILSQRERIEGERRHVTIMFVDMKGFTPLTEKLGPEETFSLMDQVFEILIHKVHEYEGTVNELRGDGILAFFGAPVALEDAPQRAIRSALSIHREMTRFNDKIKDADRIPPVLLRVGINTGPVVIGTVGNDLRVQFTAVGDTINMAARMEQMAEPGTIYVTQDTFKLTEGYFRFEALGEKEVKGKEQPLKVYRVIAPSTRRTRFEVNAEKGLTPLVARNRELSLLLDGLEEVKSGRGQAFSISSEAGAGKSRLLYEFRKAVSNEDVTFLEGKCLSYGRGMSYHPFTEILKANFFINDDDNDVQMREKVRGGLDALGMDKAWNMPIFLALLSMKDSGIEKLPISPEGRKERIVDALKIIALRGSEIRPLIVVVEDLHWIDESSEEVLQHLMMSIPGSRVLMIFTYRLEYLPEWTRKSYHTQINLNRFPDRESLTMVSHLLGTGDLDGDVQGLILHRTGGLPLFIEEFVRVLKDLGLVQMLDNKCCLAKGIHGITVPATIQEIILSRVDVLPEAAKRLLETGAVMEREVPFQLLRRVTGLSESELLSNLSILTDTELLYERGVFPQTSYIFKHALTRDVVYDSIITSRKKALHAQTGLAIEQMYDQKLDEYLGALTEHFAACGDYARAAGYARRATKRALALRSLTDAVAFGEKAVYYLEKLPVNKETRKAIVGSRTDLGLCLLQMLRYVEAKEAIAPIFDEAARSNFKERLPSLLTIVGTYASNVEEDVPLALWHFDKAAQISEELNDMPSLANVYLRRAVTLGFHCEFDESEEFFGRCIHMATSANNLWAAAIAKGFKTLFVLAARGELAEAMQTAREAVWLADQSDDTQARGVSLVALGIGNYGVGRLEESIEDLTKGGEYCYRVGMIAWLAVSHWFLGRACSGLAQYARTKDHHNTAVKIQKETGFLPSWMTLNQMESSVAAVMGGDREVDLESLRSYVHNNRLNYFLGEKKRCMSAICLYLDDNLIEEAEKWIVQAIEIDREKNMRFDLGRDYALYAEVFKRKGDRFRAKEQLGKAIEIYKECGADGWVTKAEEELAKLF